jgi:hypothetical protein
METFCEVCERQVLDRKFTKHKRGRKHGIASIQKQLKDTFKDEAKDYTVIEIDPNDTRFGEAGKYTLEQLQKLFSNPVSPFKTLDACTSPPSVEVKEIASSSIDSKTIDK